MAEARPKNSVVQRQVALFVTCLSDLLRPSVAFNAIALLEKAGCQVEVPQQQTCCGQPGYNSGDRNAARALARQTIEQFDGYDYVVVPSGSCAGMIVRHYPKLFTDQWRERAVELAARTFELTTFLHEVAPLPEHHRAATDRRICYHDSCAGLRELGIRQQPRELLATHCDTRVTELTHRDECCGFGGTFCVKMPEMSARMADEKLKDANQSGADTLVGGDLGCLLNLSGRARRMGIELEFRHVAEVLNGDLEGPAIGASKSTRAGTD